MSAQMLEVSLLGEGTVLRLERDAWSLVKLRQVKNEFAHPPVAFHSTLSSIPVMQESPPHKLLFLVGCRAPFMPLAEHLTALHAWC